MDFTEKICHGYFFAKKFVIRKGYANEIDWQEGINYGGINEQTFLHEMTWVILASGMNDKVVRKIFPIVKKIMFDFQSSSLICKKKRSCYSQALKIINHPGKIKAIIYAAEYIKRNTFQYVRDRIEKDTVDFIQTFPYMGKSTSFHLAKNIGLDVSKPDRHLVRISDVLGFNNPEALCESIAFVTQERKSLIDLILWRYATLDKDYLNTINKYLKKNNFASCV